MTNTKLYSQYPRIYIYWSCRFKNLGYFSTNQNMIITLFMLHIVPIHVYSILYVYLFMHFALLISTSKLMSSRGQPTQDTNKIKTWEISYLVLFNNTMFCFYFKSDLFWRWIFEIHTSCLAPYFIFYLWGVVGPRGVEVLFYIAF